MSRQSLRSSGFSLVELMIALTMLSIVVIAVLESFSQQHKTSIVTEDVVEVQQNVRAISYLIEREIRTAGFMVPNAVSICGVDSTVGSDQLFISETEPIVPDDVRTGDLGARVNTIWTPANGTAGWGNTFVLNLDSTTTDLDGDGSLFYDNDVPVDGVADADFREGGGFILADMANPSRGAVCGTVSRASVNQVTVEQLGGNLRAHVATSDAEEEIIIVPAAHYAVNALFATGRLERNGDLLALGVDDLQISFFFDVDDDGVIDAPLVEEPGTAAGAVYNARAWDNTELKEVRFSLVVRTRATDAAFNQGSFITFENRAVAPVVLDGFRRRAIVTAVRPRNIGIQGSI